MKFFFDLFYSIGNFAINFLWDCGLVILGIFILFQLSSCVNGMDDNVFLHAIATVETNRNNTAVGKAGERGQYQFMRATWEQYSKTPHSECARFPDEIERVAEAHLNWIKKTLTKNHIEISVENCAAIWNAGWGNFRKGFRPREYIRKVKAEYSKYKVN